MIEKRMYVLLLSCLLPVFFMKAPWVRSDTLHVRWIGLAKELAAGAQRIEEAAFVKVTNNNVQVNEFLPY